jgi:hypothetical protein
MRWKKQFGEARRRFDLLSFYEVANQQVCFWHLADINLGPENVDNEWLSGHPGTPVLTSVNDAVDGAHSAASKCHRVVA